jgi:hypothetical protein
MNKFWVDLCFYLIVSTQSIFTSGFKKDREEEKKKYFTVIHLEL